MNHHRKPRSQEKLSVEEYKQKVTSWFSTAKDKKSHYLIIALDTESHSLFPVYVGRDTNIQTKIKGFNDNQGARAIEVYNMKMDLGVQLGQARVWNV